MRALLPWLVCCVVFPVGATAQVPVDAAASVVGRVPTIADATANAFSYPLPTLSATERRAFSVGNALFRTNWVVAPASTSGLDGLGPLFNARSCSSCHLRDGRSRPPEAGEADRFGLLVRIGMRADDDGPDRPHPAYGEQLQDDAIPGVQPEARIDIEWQVTAGRYGDGSAFELIAPDYRLRELAYGPLGEGVVLGGRVAPQIIGLGLLEAIPAAALHAVADPDDRDGDGVSGRLHRLPGGRGIGRFGWKATQPTVHAQTAAAFVHDMGITSPEHPREPLTAGQRAAITAPSGGEPEIDAHKLARVVSYARTIAVPVQRDADVAAVQRGRQHFAAFGCVACHVPAWTLGAVDFLPGLAGQVIEPYTDLLLHDLGAGLADGKHDGAATPGEWRTPPLWGIGLVPTVNGHERYLHDGRARGLAEAILWHGGEALAARERFRLAPAAVRDELLAFLRSL